MAFLLLGTQVALLLSYLKHLVFFKSSFDAFIVSYHLSFFIVASKSKNGTIICDVVRWRALPSKRARPKPH